MRIAYLECFSGISGDMFLGALLDAGVPPEVFTRTVEALGVDARLEISRVDRSGISATKLDVIAAGEKELPREEFWQGALSNQQSAVSNQQSAISSQQSALQHLRLGRTHIVTQRNTKEHSALSSQDSAQDIRPWSTRITTGLRLRTRIPTPTATNTRIAKANHTAIRMSTAILTSTAMNIRMITSMSMVRSISTRIAG